MREEDAIALAAFLVSYENLEVNKRILETNLKHSAGASESYRVPERLLTTVISLLEKEK